MTTSSDRQRVGPLAALLLFVAGFAGLAILSGLILILLITLGWLPAI